MRNAIGIVTLAAALAGCATVQERVAAKEDLLAVAGFRLRPADTAERQAALSRLPPNRFLREDRNGAVVYVYADPLVCDCLYTGDEAAYGRYRQDVFQRRIANDQLLAASEMRDWSWGPWRPVW